MITLTRVALALVAAFSIAAIMHPQLHVPVLVGCADGPACAVPAQPAGPVRTVDVRWVHLPPVGG